LVYKNEKRKKGTKTTETIKLKIEVKKLGKTKKSFQGRLNVSVLGICCNDVGRVFHAAGAAYEKAR